MNPPAGGGVGDNVIILLGVFDDANEQRYAKKKRPLIFSEDILYRNKSFTERLRLNGIRNGRNRHVTTEPFHVLQVEKIKDGVA